MSNSPVHITQISYTCGTKNFRLLPIQQNIDKSAPKTHRKKMIEKKNRYYTYKRTTLIEKLRNLQKKYFVKILEKGYYL